MWCRNMVDMGECLSWPQSCLIKVWLSLFCLTCFVCGLGIQWAINHACQSGDVSDESVMSAGLTCVLFLMRLRVFLYFSMFLCVCVRFRRSRRAWQLSALFIWQESFVPLGIRCPLLCLLSKPVTRMKYKSNYLAKLNKVSACVKD